VYLIAFLCAANQFIPLLGENGLLPVPRFVRAVSFRKAPSIFFLAPTDAAFRAAAWIGIVLSALALTGLGEPWGALASASAWAALWLLYLSFVNVGWMFYAFGWETLLLETGFFTIFAGRLSTQPSMWTIWIWRWILFRLMFGAGLSKLRGDPCWRSLTCLDRYFETQPIPNRFSWHFHWLPPIVHRAGVLFNHVAELAAPLGFFAPQPFAAVAGLVTIAFQLVLITSGNLSWLNWLTIVLAIPLFDDRWFGWLPLAAPAAPPDPVQHAIALAVAAVVGVLSVRPVLNLLSPNQVMIASFGPLHLVNTYGAFSSVTRARREIAIEGTGDDRLTPETVWREYQFKGKPGDVSRPSKQIAPYHLRLDWLMWFAAQARPSHHPWFPALLEKLLAGDTQTLRLLRTNPFPDRPPRYVRAVLHDYRFTTREERRQTGHWWYREAIGLYVAPVSLPVTGVTGVRPR
jgi:Lipase maturation factor